MASALPAMLSALLLMLACSASARPIGRGLLQLIAPNTTGVNLVGFTFGSEVGAYTLLTKDVCDMTATLSASTPDFAAAMDIYEMGKNAPGRNGTLRTLKAFTTGIVYGTPLSFRLKYVSYYNDLYFMDAAVEEALAVTPATTSAQVLKLVPQGMVLLNYIMHEFEAGLNKTEFQSANNTDLVRGAPHNLDESWGLYGGTGTCGMYPLVQTMSKAFGVRKDSATGACGSKVHDAILVAFKKSYRAASKGDIASFKQGRDSLVSGLLVPFIQGTLKAAAEVSKKVALKQSAATPLAQGYGYWKAIEAVVAGADQAAADVVAEAFFLGQAPAANTYSKVLAAFESVYAKLGVNKSLVGGVGAKQYLTCDGSKQALAGCLARCAKENKWVCGADGVSFRNKCVAVCRGTSARKAGKC